MPKERQREVGKALEMINADIFNSRAGHDCKIVDGQPCCCDYQDMKRKLKEAFTALLFALLPEIPCLGGSNVRIMNKKIYYQKGKQTRPYELNRQTICIGKQSKNICKYIIVTSRCLTRWLTCVSCLGWWTLGLAINNCFARSFQRSWKYFSTIMGIDEINLAEVDEQAADDINTDFKTTVSKKLKRGAGHFVFCWYCLLCLCLMWLLCVDALCSITAVLVLSSDLGGCCMLLMVVWCLLCLLFVMYVELCLFLVSAVWCCVLTLFVLCCL